MTEWVNRNDRYPVVAIAAFTLGLLVMVLVAGSPASGDPGGKDRAKAAAKKKKVKRGPAGPAGPQGATGVQGATGAQGAQGPAGAGGPPSGAASGDLTGTYPAPTIAPGAVSGGTGGDIVDDSVTGADVDESTLQGLANGDITAVTAGTGLTGGGTSGAVTLGVAVPLTLSGGSTVIDATSTHASQTAPIHAAVKGTNTSGGYAGYFNGPLYATGSGFGLFGSSPAAGGAGVYGEASGGGWGVHGTSVSTDQSTTKAGVFGGNAAGGWAGFFDGPVSVDGEIDVDGELSANNPSGNSVVAISTATGSYGLYAEEIGDGAGAARFIGEVDAQSGTGHAIESTSSNLNGAAVKGTASNQGWGLHGTSNATSQAFTAAGVFGGNTSGGWAGYFQGPVKVTGNLNVDGTLTKGGGTFRIDHPLDPKDKYLSHSFVESPEMMNVYNGNVVTDDEGFATVELPSYFDALNKDFRYQLTPIGTFADAIVAEEIEDNAFVIQTDEPDVKVSWQVTGVRDDEWARQHPVVVEQLKSEAEGG